MSERAKALRDYLSIVPLSIDSAAALYTGYLRYLIRSSMAHSKPRTVGQCLVAKNPLCLMSDGLRFLVRPRSDDLGYITEHHKPAVARWFRPRASEVVVDIGSYIGFFSLLAAARGSWVISIEPSPSTFEILAKNIALNGLQNVMALNIGVGRNRELRLLTVPNVLTGLASFSLGSPAIATGDFSTSKVTIEPLDSIEELRKFTVIDWMLIDTEGWEADVLQGGPKSLAKTRRVIVEVQHGTNAEDCHELLEASRFELQEIAPQSEINEYRYYTRTS